MLSVVRLTRGSSYKVGHDFQILHTRVQQQCFFSEGNCLSRFPRLQLFMIFLKSTSDVPSSLAASRRTNRDVSGEVDAYSAFLYGILGNTGSLTHSLIAKVLRLNFLHVGHERSSSRVHSGLCSKAWMAPTHWLFVDASTWP